MVVNATMHSNVQNAKRNSLPCAFAFIARIKFMHTPNWLFDGNKNYMASIIITWIATSNFVCVIVRCGWKKQWEIMLARASNALMDPIYVPIHIRMHPICSFIFSLALALDLALSSPHNNCVRTCMHVQFTIDIITMNPQRIIVRCSLALWLIRPCALLHALNVCGKQHIGIKFN